MSKKGQGRPFSNIEVSAFCSQIALILKSGISSLEGVMIMLEDTSSPEEKANARMASLLCYLASLLLLLHRKINQCSCSALNLSLA